jgi:hypothetical protein
MIVTRSGRVSRPPEKLTLALHHHLPTQAHHVREEYSIVNARVIAMIMCHINESFLVDISNNKRINLCNHTVSERV